MSRIRDVAKQAGVSPSTVSRAFTTPELINADTQQRVFEAARELNYRPPQLRPSRHNGRSLKNSPISSSEPALSNAIGFQFFTSSADNTLATNMFYAPILAGAQAEAAALHMHLLVHTTNRDDLMMELPRMVREQAIGGMLIVGTADPRALETFAAHIPHIVLVDHHEENGRFESILSDGFQGAYQATKYLMECGHRRIGFFAGDPNVSTFRDRQRGFLCAQFEAGILPDPKLIVGNKDEELQAALLTKFLLSPERPTALLAVNDHCAHTALRICREIGIDVPIDLSVIGFDNIVFSAHTHPPLTTVHVDKEYMGRLAVRRLYSQISGDHSSESVGERGIGSSIKHLIPVSLVLRQSCRFL